MGMYWKRTQTQNRFIKTKKLVLLLPLVCLLGCYAGSVKPLLSRPEFKAENEPIRNLRILLITDNSYRKDEIEQFVSKCSRLVEMQVGIRLEILDWYQIKWENELDDIIKMEIRIAGDTWSKRDKFDIALAFVHFVHSVEGGKLPLGATDTFFWRYIFVRELDPYILLHELFHAFLLHRGHSKEWVMRGGRPAYGNEWYWLTPEDRKGVLRNKWRDFNVMPATEQEEERKSKESWFYYKVGSAYLQKREFDQAILLLNKSLEINPKYAAAYETRGIIYSSREQYDQAIADFNKAVEIDPRLGEAYISRGKAYYFKGEYDKSWEDVKKAQNLGFQVSPKFLDDLRKASWRQN
jgi:tetratricopeptide (TPR) repeat protein